MPLWVTAALMTRSIQSPSTVPMGNRPEVTKHPQVCPHTREHHWTTCRRVNAVNSLSARKPLCTRRQLPFVGGNLPAEPLRLSSVHTKGDHLALQDDPAGGLVNTRGAIA